jgi:glutaminyl-peptide cyclotransferase
MKHAARIFPLFMLVIVWAITLGSAQAQDGNPLADPVEVLVPEVVSVREHDPGAFTQGLVFHNGLFYESTGRFGESTLREVDPQTGAVLRSINIPEEYFAEGLALVDGKLIQLTWKNEVAFIYDLATFAQVGTFTYTGEGWGLCYDGRYLYMSDGSPFIDMRDPQTFELIFSGLVTVQGQVVNNINELECVGDYIYANVWQTDYILKIDKTNGVVVGIVDASALVPPADRAQLDPQEVMNGIAYQPDTDTFLITGKHWSKMYEVRFVPQEKE